MSGNGNGGDRDFSLFARYQDYLDRITGGMSGVRRWKKYHRDGLETVGEHTVQQTYIVRDLYDLECSCGSPHGLDEALLLRCSMIHDTGEGVNEWDAPQPLKQHAVIGPLLEQMEHEAVREHVIGPMPKPLADMLTRDYAVQHDMESRNGRFFRASEVVGYVIRAVQQYRLGERDPASIARRLGAQVFAHQYRDICKWAEEFVSVRIVLDQFREEVEYALLHDSECIAYAQQHGKDEEIRSLIAARGNGDTSFHDDADRRERAPVVAEQAAGAEGPKEF
ncbi:MAG: HD domain-containing protein [bacterium]|nr:HD domain-containing protein [bacterium]